MEVNTSCLPWVSPAPFPRWCCEKRAECNPQQLWQWPGSLICPPTALSHCFTKATCSFCRDGDGSNGGSSAFGPGYSLVNGFL